MTRADLILEVKRNLMYGPHLTEEMFEAFVRKVYAHTGNPEIKLTPEQVQAFAEFAKRHEPPPLPRLPEPEWLDPSIARREARLARRGRTLEQIMSGQ